MKVKKAYHANPATTKAVMTMIGTILVAISPVLISKWPEVALVLSTVGGVMGGGAYVRSPGTEPIHAPEATEGE
jgi:hypothetical protein